ncbi:MAG: NUDIX hydrolase [Pseudomonadota bacterium]
MGHGSHKAAEAEKPRSDRPAALQYAALCYRRTDDGIDVLLITSRGTGRWIIPKGWAMEDLSDHATAAREALEEAGVVGKIKKKSIGTYPYSKWMPAEMPIECSVKVYPLEVSQLEDDYLEKDERERRWFSRKKAASKVDEPELKELILDFKPS